MARKKVQLAYIENSSARKATFKKRKRGLLKKVSELSTLCGIDACAIVYGKNDPEPEVWSTENDPGKVLKQFRDMSEMDQSKKMMNQDAFLRQRIMKIKEQVKKQQRDNRECEITQLMYRSSMGDDLQDAKSDELSDMSLLIQGKKKEIQQRMDELQRVMPAPLALAGNDQKILGNEIVPEHRPWWLDAMNSSHEQQQQQQQQQLPPPFFGGVDIVMPYVDNTPWSNLYPPFSWS